MAEIYPKYNVLYKIPRGSTQATWHTYGQLNINKLNIIKSRIIKMESVIVFMTSHCIHIKSTLIVFKSSCHLNINHLLQIFRKLSKFFVFIRGVVIEMVSLEVVSWNGSIFNPSEQFHLAAKWNSSETQNFSHSQLLQCYWAMGCFNLPKT